MSSRLSDNTITAEGSPVPKEVGGNPKVVSFKKAFGSRLLPRLRSLRFNRQEISGSLGDLGIYIPLTIGLVSLCGLNAALVLFLSGLANVLTGFFFGTPIPVQPMKAIAAIAISERLGPQSILTAGIITGLFLFVLGITNTTRLLSRVIPIPVVYGILLGLGLSLVHQGLKLALTSALFVSGEALVLGSSFLVILFFSVRRSNFPLALMLFALGLITIYWKEPHHFLLTPARIYSPLSLFSFSLKDLYASLHLILPQIPLTLINSVIAVCALSDRLFPNSSVNPRSVSISVGLMNLIGCPLGGMPVCHGAGGLAGQYHFGAYTGGSMVFLGGIKIALGVFMGSSAIVLLSSFPTTLLGLLLVLSGIELALAANRTFETWDLLMLLVTGFSIFLLKITPGFALGLIFAYSRLAIIKLIKSRTKISKFGPHTKEEGQNKKKISQLLQSQRI